jgi:hypothetical protein
MRGWSQVPVLTKMSELAELATLGEKLSFSVLNVDRIAVTLDAHSDDIIPDGTVALFDRGAR